MISGLFPESSWRLGYGTKCCPSFTWWCVSLSFVCELEKEEGKSSTLPLLLHPPLAFLIQEMGGWAAAAAEMNGWVSPSPICCSKHLPQLALWMDCPAMISSILSIILFLSWMGWEGHPASSPYFAFVHGERLYTWIHYSTLLGYSFEVSSFEMILFSMTQDIWDLCLQSPTCDDLFPTCKL